MNKDEIIKEIEEIKKESRWTVLYNKYSKDAGTIGYCYSPKSGKWGVFFNTRYIHSTATFSSEYDALTALWQLLVMCPVKKQ